MIIPCNNCKTTFRSGNHLRLHNAQAPTSKLGCIKLTSKLFNLVGSDGTHANIILKWCHVDSQQCIKSPQKTHSYCHHICRVLVSPHGFQNNHGCHHHHHHHHDHHCHHLCRVLGLVSPRGFHYNQGCHQFRRVPSLNASLSRTLPCLNSMLILLSKVEIHQQQNIKWVFCIWFWCISAFISIRCLVFGELKFKYTKNPDINYVQQSTLAPSHVWNQGLLKCVT